LEIILKNELCHIWIFLLHQLSFKQTQFYNEVIELKKIIIVEDTNFLRLKLESALLKNNIEKCEALNSKLATEKYIQFRMKNVGLTIIDLDNYHSNGIELIKLIRKSFDKTQVPIMVMSRNVDISILKLAVAVGCNDFILKPYSDSDLIYKVKCLLGEIKKENNHTHKYSPLNLNEESTTTFNWHEDFTINIKQIDDEHKSIIAKYKTLYVLMKEGNGYAYYNELIDYLNDYVITHFTNEENFHEQESYPLSDEHKALHEKFKLFLRENTKEKTDMKTTHSDLIKINLFIKNWWIHHILIEDKKFGRFMDSKKENAPN